MPPLAPIIDQPAAGPGFGDVIGVALFVLAVLLAVLYAIMSRRNTHTHAKLPSDEDGEGEAPPGADDDDDGVLLPHTIESATALSPLEGYEPAFLDEDEPFLTYYEVGKDKMYVSSTYTRGDIWSLARRAATVLKQNGIGHGDKFIHLFSGNTVDDVVFRLAGVMRGAAPVTVNWSADNADRLAYKTTLSDSRLMVVGPWDASNTVFDDLDMGLDVLKERFGGDEVKVFHTSSLMSSPSDFEELDEDDFLDGDTAHDNDPQIIIFTSGTTGNPKGVKLSHRNYITNRSTFETFLQVEGRELVTMIVNPMHHTNSTSLVDWSLRRPHTRLNLFQRYSTQYWAQIEGIVASASEDACIVAPLVARHIDFLDGLSTAGKLPLEPELLKATLNRVHIMIGSAPVGPTTVDRFLKYAGKLPVVRFGSTETCLQVMGTPVHLSEEVRLSTFKRGWEHSVDDVPTKGFYIGRPHWPYTQSRVVKSVDKGTDGYMVDCDEGKTGYLICAGDNVMSGYLGNDEATIKVLHRHGQDLWYTNFGDICFQLVNPEDGEADTYWVTRDSALLIRGGANYAYDQVSAEITQFVKDEYALLEGHFQLAVVGLKIDSEHEDSCVVTVQLNDALGDRVAEVQARMEGLVQAAKGKVSKGAKPDHVRFGQLPLTFKGTVETKTLKKACEAWAADQGITLL